MEAIAKSARLNKAMLHYYFKNKKNLHSQVVENLIDAEWLKDQAFLHIVKELSPVQRIFVALHSMALRHSRGKDPTLSRIMAWELAEGRETVHRVYRKYVVPRLLMLVESIEQGIKQGTFRAADPLLVIWNAVSFFVFYSMQRVSYHQTELYDRLYVQRGVGHLLDYILDVTAKQLGLDAGFPEPPLPDEAREFVREARAEIYAGIVNRPAITPKGKKRVEKK